MDWFQSSEKQQGLNKAIFLNHSLALAMNVIHSPCQGTDLMDAVATGDSKDFDALGFLVSRMERPGTQLAPQGPLSTWETLVLLDSKAQSPRYKRQIQTDKLL